MAEESLHAFVHGRVQGIFFRDFVQRRAQTLSLAGFVRNLPDGETVEVLAEGKKEKLELLLVFLKSGPKGCRVDRVEFEWGQATGRERGFRIAL